MILQSLEKKKKILVFVCKEHMMIALICYVKIATILALLVKVKDQIIALYVLIKILKETIMYKLINVPVRISFTMMELI